MAVARTPQSRPAERRRPSVASPAPLDERRLWPLLLGLLGIVDAVLLVLAGRWALDVRTCYAPFGACRLVPLDPVWLNRGLYVKVVALYVPLTLGVLASAGAYRRTALFRGMGEYQSVLFATGLGTLLTQFAAFLTYHGYAIARGWLVLVWLLSALFVGSWRFALRRVLRRLRVRQVIGQRALVVGAGRAGQILEWHLHQAPTEGIRVVGFVDDTVPLGDVVVPGRNVLGRIDDLAVLVEQHRIDQVYVAAGGVSTEGTLRALERALPTRADVLAGPNLLGLLTTDAAMVRRGGDVLLVLNKIRITGVDSALKTALDLLGSAVLLVLSAPLWLAIACAVRLSSPGPIFVRHRTLGAGGTAFDALKFRTTRSGVDADHPVVAERRRKGLPVRSHPDLTAVGRVLTRFSLDELPQLLNVLARQMSLVGPYKISPDQLPLYKGRHVALLTVRPGITGVCQIHGRGELTIEERSLLDAEYVRTYSIWRDVQILLATVLAVLHRRGAY